MKYLAAGLFFVFSITLAFAGGWLIRRSSDRAIAQDHARWIARYLHEANNLDKICKFVSEEQKVAILREEWNAGTGPEAATGPIVGNQRIVVAQDQSIRWHPAH